MAEIYYETLHLTSSLAPKLAHPGSLHDLRATMKATRAKQPANIYGWVGMSYKHPMLSGLTNLGPLDSEKFPGPRY